MTQTTRATILFWCQVALYLTIMGAIITTMILFAFWLNTLRLDMEEDRARDRAMLQQQSRMLDDHGNTMAATYAAFQQMLADHRAASQR